MSTIVRSQVSRSEWERALAKPLDEAVWQTWIAKGRTQDRRSSAARTQGVKWISIVGLLAVAGLWSHITTYEVVVRLTLVAGAMVVMFHAFHTRQYAFGAVFGALALIYNPIVPAFNLSGGWERALVVASTVPFLASLAWSKCEAVTQ